MARENDVSRRDFLHLVGTGAALAGLGACAQEPEEKIVPYDRTPEGVTPDHPIHYATSMLTAGLATGLLVRSFNGRPVKVEGNPQHPASLGGTGIYHQASLLDLYDPRRARGTLLRGEPRPYDECISDFTGVIGRGDGLRFLLEPTSSPLIESMLARLPARYPGARVYFHAPFGHAHEIAGLKRLTGQVVQPRYTFDRAEVIVALDADFLNAATWPPRYAHDFADGRRTPERGMNRLYAVESTLSITGATADNRMAVRPSEVRAVAAELLSELHPEAGLPRSRPQVKAVARDMAARPSRSVVVVGHEQPAEVHAVACAINQALKSDCVTYAPSPILDAGQLSHDLAELVDELRRGVVQQLIILEGNPVRTAFVDLELGELVGRVPRSLYLGLHFDETGQSCRWFAPAAHFLESWGDGRAWDGTVSFVQPLIRPLYGGKTAAEVIASLTGDAFPKSHDLLRECWSRRPEMRGTWDEAIQRGFLPGTATTPAAIEVNWRAVSGLTESPSHGEIEMQIGPGYAAYDGRYEGNEWLQELPHTITQQTWGNAALISPATAASLGVETGRRLVISRGERFVTIPALVLPGHADGATSLAAGYGGAVGVDVGLLWTSNIPDGIAPVKVEVIDGTETLAFAQIQREMEHRPVALSATLTEYSASPAARPSNERMYTLFPAFEQRGNQWGMAIDMSVCTGCSACVIACRAENNIAIVGKENVVKGRIMHWLRIDRYFGAAGVEMQPMLCQHCEKAPCEYVCPVNATTHSPDGINEMTYNRCVGTRFCSNNCPYKVRRFNWFNFNAGEPPVLKMIHNPDVTVRGRGVMEKCTYCVQRVRETEIRAEREHRAIRDLEIRTACQQACPTNAIVFGDVADGETAVSKQMANPRTYKVLEDLGTEPRTRYLTRIRNPNPELT